MRKCPVVKLCQALKVSRSGFYAWLTRVPSKREINNQKLSRKLIELHQVFPVYGLDTLYHILKRDFSCSRGRVHRLMKKYGIYSHRHKSKNIAQYRKHSLPVKDNLLKQNFTAKIPNSVWVGDVSYIKTFQGFLFLAIVKDLCTKQIVGYAMSDKFDSSLVINALDNAVKLYKPNNSLIFYSDRGSQYASLKFQERLQFHGVKGSMSHSGNPCDNAVAESFFSSLKCELVHLTTFFTKEQAQLELFYYIQKYNNIRPHSSIGWISPNQFAQNYYSISA